MTIGSHRDKSVHEYMEAHSRDVEEQKTILRTASTYLAQGRRIEALWYIQDRMGRGRPWGDTLLGRGYEAALLTLDRWDDLCRRYEPWRFLYGRLDEDSEAFGQFALAMLGKPSRETHERFLAFLRGDALQGWDYGFDTSFSPTSATVVAAAYFVRATRADYIPGFSTRQLILRRALQVDPGNALLKATLGMEVGGAEQVRLCREAGLASVGPFSEWNLRLAKEMERSTERERLRKK